MNSQLSAKINQRNSKSVHDGIRQMNKTKKKQLSLESRLKVGWQALDDDTHKWYHALGQKDYGADKTWVVMKKHDISEGDAPAKKSWGRPPKKSD